MGEDNDNRQHKPLLKTRHIYQPSLTAVCETVTKLNFQIRAPCHNLIIGFRAAQHDFKMNAFQKQASFVLVPRILQLCGGGSDDRIYVFLMS